MKFILFLLVLTSSWGYAQQSLSLEECQTLAQESYAIVKQRNEIQKILDLSLKNNQTAYLPQVELNAQATYQSDVTSIPISLPSVEVPTISKDQYRATLDVRQLLYDGGVTQKQKQLSISNERIEQQKIEVSLHQLKNRVTQLYFNILLQDENMGLANLLREDLEARIRKVSAGVTNGAVLKSNLEILQAELLRTEQKLLELQSSRKALLQTVGILINKELQENVLLQKPIIGQTLTIQLDKRPENQLFDLQSKYLQNQSELLQVKNTPKLSAFFQGGYGRPGLNMLNNEFDVYYVTGVKLNWPIWNWNTTKNDRKILEARKNILASQQEDFTKNLDIALQNYLSDIHKLQQLMEKDKEIIAIRNTIRERAAAQVENGIITSNDYLVELNAHNQAQLNLKLHELQLLMTQATYHLESGN
jgi:outer membrane protein TolC